MTMSPVDGVFTRAYLQPSADGDVLTTGSLTTPAELSRDMKEIPSVADSLAKKGGAGVEALPTLPAAQARQLAQADELLRVGDVIGARLVLERAARQGSALAVFKLAETYDPRRLRAWGVYGLRAQAITARELYKRAHILGVEEAQQRAQDLL
jgi:hypothetical protein